MTAEEMLAREAIRFKLELYCRASDNANYALHHQVFHPDGVFDLQGQGELRGPDEIIAFLLPAAEKRGAFEPGNFQRHNLTTTMIDFTDAQTARVTTYIIVVTELGVDHTGRYDDVFTRHQERWLIKRRKVTMEWARPDSRFTRWLGAAQPVGREGPA